MSLTSRAIAACVFQAIRNALSACKSERRWRMPIPRLRPAGHGRYRDQHDGGRLHVGITETMKRPPPALPRGVPIVPRTILNVTVVLLLAVPFAHAAEPAGELLLEIDGSGLTQKTAEFIGTYGALSAYAPDADSTLKSIVESQCGDAPSEYIWALRVANKKPDLTYESVLEKGELLDLPPCPPRTTGSLVARVVKDGDRIWDYYTEFGKDKLAFGAGAETIAKIDSPFQSTFPTSPRASDPELETALTGIGLQVKSFNELVKTLPLQTPYKIDVMSDSEITYSDVIKAINPRITSLDKIAKDQVIIVPESTKQEYSLPLARAEDGEQLASLGPEGLSAMTGTEISQASRSDGFVFSTR